MREGSMTEGKYDRGQYDRGKVWQGTVWQGAEIVIWTIVYIWRQHVFTKEQSFKIHSYLNNAKSLVKT